MKYCPLFTIELTKVYNITVKCYASFYIYTITCAVLNKIQNISLMFLKQKKYNEA